VVDVVSRGKRSQMMAGIKGKNTSPEIALRRGLHARGFRFRLHRRDLPGAPDLVFPSRRAVLFAHGCFWHRHDCHLFKWPSTRREFWRDKISQNAARDELLRERLAVSGWRVGVVWECALKGRTRRSLDEVLNECAEWLSSDRQSMEISGK
jgi:DNA mismatch endonuclease (patch repair protein)